MPLLPLPLGGSSIASNDLPIVDTTSIAALEPYLVRDSDSAPVRDSIRRALVAMFTFYQDATSASTAQSNVLYATGIYLDGLGADEGVFRYPSEPYTQTGDAAYRARILVQGGTVTPTVIMLAVNAILAPYTAIKAHYLESIMDRGYCRSSGTNPNVAYVRDGTTAGDRDPTYLDRLYPNDAAQNLGVSIDDRRPGGFWCFSDTIGRYFVLRIPPLDSVDNAGAFAFNGQLNSNGVTPESLGYGIFCGDGTSTIQPWWDFFRTSPATSADIYATIVNTVNRLLGASIRWELIVDPLLT